MNSFLRRSLLYIAVAIGTSISIIYLIAFLDQFISKGWRDEDARQITMQVASHISNQDKTLKIDTAQQYSDGCSFLLFEVYTHKCFSIKISAPISTNLKAYDLNQITSVVASKYWAIRGQQSTALHRKEERNVRITLILESFEERIESDGTKIFLKSEIRRSSMEIK